MTDEKKLTKEETKKLYNSLSQEQKDKMIKLGKLMADEEFSKRLMDDPTVALKAEGIEVPENWDVDKKELQNILDTVPQNPASSELKDDQLDGVSGGISVYQGLGRWEDHNGQWYLSRIATIVIGKDKMKKKNVE